MFNLRASGGSADGYCFQEEYVLIVMWMGVGTGYT